MQFEYLITRNKGYYCCLLGSGSRKREHVKCSTYTNSCGAHDNKSQHRSYNMRIMHLYVLLNNDRGSWYAGACTPPRSVFLNWPGVPSARKNDKVFSQSCWTALHFIFEFIKTLKNIHYTLLLSTYASCWARQRYAKGNDAFYFISKSINFHLDVLSF